MKQKFPNTSKHNTPQYNIVRSVTPIDPTPTTISLTLLSIAVKKETLATLDFRRMVYIYFILHLTMYQEGKSEEDIKARNWK